MNCQGRCALAHVFCFVLNGCQRDVTPFSVVNTVCLRLGHLRAKTASLPLTVLQAGTVATGWQHLVKATCCCRDAREMEGEAGTSGRERFHTVSQGEPEKAAEAKFASQQPALAVANPSHHREHFLPPGKWPASIYKGSAYLAYMFLKGPPHSQLHFIGNRDSRGT